jgi:hypothetical protein
MRTTSLASILASVVGSSLAVGCALFEDCPHTVIDRETTVKLSSDDACKNAKDLESPWGYVSPTKLAACRKLCNDGAITDCHLPYGYYPTTDDAGATTCPTPEAGNTVVLTCQVAHSEGTYSSGCPVAGRRTDGVSGGDVRAGASVGAFFAQCAGLEATAVIAFRRLVDELVALGVDGALVARARRAVADEIEHTDAMSWLATRNGASVEMPRHEVLPLRSMFEVALENAVEGRVRETFGAAVALHQARTAVDGATRRILARIAEEEREHAELAADLEAWFAERLTEEERARIEAAKLSAIAELRAEHGTETDALLVTCAGLPTRAEASVILDGLERLVWSRAQAA